MTKVSLDDHSGPWSEEEFLALDATNYRLELLDGSLWVTPRPIAPHQDISGHLYVALLPAAKAAGLRVRQDVDVRLATARILQPDLIISKGERVVTVTKASDVLLACEITSPSNAAMDRITKKELYAAANIKWYLLIEPETSRYESVTLHLFRLEAGRYQTYAVAEGNKVLTLEEPLRATINGNSLLGLEDSL
ncbi:Uma2 family endonuclease [Actinoplanes sp. NPDC026670]|uniref:Uma2 family endonuclease n=1 Tax=Actinoplanes sp. NPDC026670 TaxID=3154700 RepID=UPI0033E46170